MGKQPKPDSKQYADLISEINKTSFLLMYTDFFNDASNNYPNGWLEEKDFLKWVENRIKENILNKLIEVIDLSKGPRGAVHKELLGEYKIITESREIILFMRFDATYRSGKEFTSNQKVIKVEPLFEYMIDWSMSRVREFCTLHQYRLERINIIEYA